MKSSREFVSVQPMNLPSGLIFLFGLKYNNGQFGGSNYSGSSLFGGDGSDLGSTNTFETVFMEMVDLVTHNLTKINSSSSGNVTVDQI